MSRAVLDLVDVQEIIFRIWDTLLKHVIRRSRIYTLLLSIFLRPMIVEINLYSNKMSMLGVNNKMLTFLKSLYQNVQCTVRINGICIEWFQVETGLKQGCILPPLLFNGLVNDLVQELNALECGISLMIYLCYLFCCMLMILLFYQVMISDCTLYSYM